MIGHVRQHMNSWMVARSWFARGCKNAAGKLRERWLAIAETKFTKLHARPNVTMWPHVTIVTIYYCCDHLWWLWLFISWPLLTQVTTYDICCHTRVSIWFKPTFTNAMPKHDIILNLNMKLTSLQLIIRTKRVVRWLLIGAWTLPW